MLLLTQASLKLDYHRIFDRDVYTDSWTSFSVLTTTRRELTVRFVTRATVVVYSIIILDVGLTLGRKSWPA